MQTAVESAANRQWNQVLARESNARFFYAVITTGIFCKPGCPSRRPARNHVRFFASAGEAEAAGFRACLRCHPQSEDAHAEMVTRLGSYLREHRDRQVPLAELGALAGVSPFTVQRSFKRVLGLSPRQYANSLRAAAFRVELEGGTPVTEAVYAAGFSAPSRAAGAASLGMAATAYRGKGKGESIGYCIDAAPHAELGLVLVAATGRGICAVLLGDSPGELAAELRRRFPAASIAENGDLQPKLGIIFNACSENPVAQSLPLDLRGTAFQARVWAALGTIPHGETRTYAQVAQAIDQPRAVRAVAAACGANPVAVLVPCHRVIGSGGALTGYRWGTARKRALLDREQIREQVPDLHQNQHQKQN